MKTKTITLFNVSEGMPNVWAPYESLRSLLHDYLEKDRIVKICQAEIEQINSALINYELSSYTKTELKKLKTFLETAIKEVNEAQNV